MAQHSLETTKQTRFKMSWRLASRLSVITLAVLVVIVVMVIQQQRSATLQGTDMGKAVAPNFTLTDQYGKTVSLDQFRGKPVVLTFLYTNCPDVCPITAEYLHESVEQLGSDADKVAILAVSTDPQRDDTTAALTFSKQHGMENHWHYLTGTKETLAPIWSNYSIAAQTQQMKVNHTSALYFIDKTGHERVLISDSFKPEQVTQNLRVLLNE